MQIETFFRMSRGTLELTERKSASEFEADSQTQREIGAALASQSCVAVVGKYISDRAHMSLSAYKAYELLMLAEALYGANANIKTHSLETCPLHEVRARLR